MSSKISISEIISGHIFTLKDANTGKISKTDWTLFIFLPLIVAGFACYHQFILPKDVVSNVVTVGVLLSGLLLNLLVLIYGIKNKIPKVDLKDPLYKENQAKHNLLDELYYNVTTATLGAFLLLLLAIANSLFIGKNFYFTVFSINAYLTDPLIIFFGLNLVITFLMIIKRTYLLLVSER